VSRLDPSGADQIDAEHQATDLAMASVTVLEPLRSPLVGDPVRACPRTARPRCRWSTRSRGGAAADVVDPGDPLGRGAGSDDRLRPSVQVLQQLLQVVPRASRTGRSRVPRTQLNDHSPQVLTIPRTERHLPWEAAADVVLVLFGKVAVAPLGSEQGRGPVCGPGVSTGAMP
jgi:hypothetical protein